MKEPNEKGAFEMPRNSYLSQDFYQKRIDENIRWRFDVVIYINRFSEKESDHFMIKRLSIHFLDEVAHIDVQKTFSKYCMTLSLIFQSLRWKSLVYGECSRTKTKIKNKVNVDYYWARKDQISFSTKNVSFFCKNNDQYLQLRRDCLTCVCRE